MASGSFTRFNAMSVGLRLYMCLALASMLAAWGWKAMSFPTVLPQSFPIRFYQQFIGHLDGRLCPSYPVCSLYAREALDKHGGLVGSWLIVDRLIHEAGDLQTNRWLMIDGEERFYDPLRRNDSWL